MRGVSLVSVFFIGLSFFSFYRCAKQDVVAEAVRGAHLLLNTSDCQSALNVLQTIGHQPRNASYLLALSSAYACKASFSLSRLIATDLLEASSPTPLGGLTKFSTSTMEFPEDVGFVGIQQAIDTLLFAGGIEETNNPTSLLRAQYFSKSDLDLLESQLFFLIMAQLGRYMRFYGNGNAQGVKGRCFVSYENLPLTVGDLNLMLQSSGGACTGAPATGHAALGSGADNTVNASRLCYGVMLVNNFKELAPKVLSAYAGDTVSNLSTFSTITQVVDTAISTATSGLYDMTTVSGVLGHKRCLNNIEAISNDTRSLQIFSAFYLESLFQ